MMSHHEDRMAHHAMTIQRQYLFCISCAACLVLTISCFAGVNTASNGRPGTLAANSGLSINARSCEFDAVLDAVGTARPGDTVLIPAGSCNWGRHELDVPANVHLSGAGKDVTTIRRSGNVANSLYLIAFDCSRGGTVQFSGLSLVGNGNGTIQDKGLGLLQGCIDFVVTNSSFRNFIFSAIYVGDAQTQRGVIFDCDFIDNYSPALRNLGYGVVVYGGGTWPELHLGTQDAVFVEDNRFSGNRHNIASNNGSAYVFRHNTVIGLDPAKDFAMTDAHGMSSSVRGSRSYEIYGNHYSVRLAQGLQRTAIGIRGGDGVIFDNVVEADISRAIELSAEGFACGSHPGPDQIRSLYIWNNSYRHNDGRFENGIDNECPGSIQLNRDYFLNAKPGYRPYPYPHPLRRT
jgi:hypothetical protein